LSLRFKRVDNRERYRIPSEAGFLTPSVYAISDNVGGVKH